MTHSRHSEIAAHGRRNEHIDLRRIPTDKQRASHVQVETCHTEQKRSQEVLEALKCQLAVLEWSILDKRAKELLSRMLHAGHHVGCFVAECAGCNFSVKQDVAGVCYTLKMGWCRALLSCLYIPDFWHTSDLCLPRFCITSHLQHSDNSAVT